jgi:hypothetical protein
MRSGKKLVVLTPGKNVKRCVVVALNARTRPGHPRGDGAEELRPVHHSSRRVPPPVPPRPAQPLGARRLLHHRKLKRSCASRRRSTVGARFTICHRTRRRRTSLNGPGGSSARSFIHFHHIDAREEDTHEAHFITQRSVQLLRPDVRDRSVRDGNATKCMGRSQHLRRRPLACECAGCPHGEAGRPPVGSVHDDGGLCRAILSAVVYVPSITGRGGRQSPGRAGPDLADLPCRGRDQ